MADKTVPVMTRLNQDELAVLDTLVEAGIASSRSAALNSCVRYVKGKEGGLLRDLRKALEPVTEMRGRFSA